MREVVLVSTTDLFDQAVQPQAFEQARDLAAGLAEAFLQVAVAQAADPLTGELKSVAYNDSVTPMVSYTYDRLGRQATITDATGSRLMIYDPDSLAPATETFDTGNTFAGLVITQTYQGSGSGLVPGRWSGVKLGTSSDDDAYYAATYGYDALGRLASAQGPGLPAGGVTYEFLQNGSNEETGLLQHTLFKDGSNNTKLWTELAYESQRDLVTSVTNTFGDENSTATISKYAYAYDTLARRTSVVRTGAAFNGGSGDHNDTWQYNGRNELARSDRFESTTPGSGTPDNDLDRLFTYDGIGNRITSKIGDNDDPNLPASYYQANSLNQYFDIAGYSPFIKRNLSYDADGNLSQTYAVGDINGDGVVSLADLTLFNSHYGDTCDDIQSPPNHLTAAEFARADVNGDCVLGLGDLTSLISGFGSNEVGSYVGYTWDGENRLTRVEPLARDASSGAIDASLRKLEFVYDYKGRRVEKRVYQRDATNNANWGPNPTERGRFIWGSAAGAGFQGGPGVSPGGWLMLRETTEIDSAADGTFESTRTKTYAWGRDLSGSLESAGGIGGLLSVHDDNATTTGGNPTNDDLRLVFCYDANGNVGQVVDWAATSSSAGIKARYEYDAYGVVIGPDGDGDGDWRDDAAPNALDNPYRFSTKPWDDETGLGYWGFRYYEPKMGRWLGRDQLPDPNLYWFCNNAPSIYGDFLGLYVQEKPPTSKPASSPTSKPSPCPKCDQAICDKFCQHGFEPCPKEPLPWDQRPGGGTLCVGNKACTCVCPDNGFPVFDEKTKKGHLECVEEHEQSHCQKDNPDCAGVDKGGKPKNKADECTAYCTQLDCLTKRLRRDAGEISSVINNIETACIQRCGDSQKCTACANQARVYFGLNPK